MSLKGSFLLCLALIALSGCATTPTGPSVLVLPAPGKPFEVFQSDDAVCRQWASQQIGVQPGESANKTLVSGTAVGTLLGAGLGMAIGAATGQFGAGLGIGAASGAIVGTAAGIGPASGTQWEAQRRYDNAYVQCMYSKGNQVPGVRTLGVPFRRLPHRQVTIRHHPAHILRRHLVDCLKEELTLRRYFAQILPWIMDGMIHIHHSICLSTKNRQALPKKGRDNAYLRPEGRPCHPLIENYLL